MLVGNWAKLTEDTETKSIQTDPASELYECGKTSRERVERGKRIGIQHCVLTRIV